MKRLLIAPIRFYRRYLSSAKPHPTCRFYPTCSAYAVKAIDEWGAFAGSFLAVWRILRCNPFGGKGFDPVPRKKRKTVPKTFGFTAIDSLYSVRAGFDPVVSFWRFYEPSEKETQNIKEKKENK